jgi:hypothetical protein
MNKPAVALIVATLTAMTSVHAMEATGTLADAQAMAARDNKPLLVEFYTEW